MAKIKINYNGTELENIYKLALIGANFVTEKSENGVTTINPVKKHLYIKTTLLSRFLKVLELPGDTVMSLEQFNTHNVAIEDFKGKGIDRLKADFEIFTDMLNDEISNLITCNNDIMNRINETIAIEMTPEKLENLTKQQNELMAELNKVSE